MKLEKPIMLYDGTCSFCKRWIVRFEKLTGDRVGYGVCQEYVGRIEGLTEKMCLEAVCLLDVDGSLFMGAEAVFRSLKEVRGYGWLYSLYKKNRFFAWMSEKAYCWVARNRKWLSKLI